MTGQAVRTSTGMALCVALHLCPAAGAAAEPALTQTMDNVVTRLYATLDEPALRSIDHKTALKLLTPTERKVLATKYWTFDVNVPVVVSVIRNRDQRPVPFWLEPAGFEKTDLTVKNEIWTYEVWQKRFDAGRVELGINGFGKHRIVYFVCVGPQEPGATVKIANLFPAGEAVITMKKGAWTYRDWNELVIEELPRSLEGHHLLTTFRGRAREAHLVGAFRKTPYPSSARPDHVALTWSDDPRTTQTIQWRTHTDVKRGAVRYRPKGEPVSAEKHVAAERAVIEDRLLMNDRTTHRFTAVLRGLKPGTTYAYTVGSPESGAWLRDGTFTTAPGREAPFSFVYFGDTHLSTHWRDVLKLAHHRHPATAFYLIGGDVVSTGLYRNEWDHVFAYSAGAFGRKPVMFALGNHDDQDGLGAWLPLALFEFPHNGPAGVEPERTYSFRYGNALFLVLDVGTSYEVQARWMEKVLAETDATWRFGIYHFPLYCHPEDDEYGPIRKRWERVFAKHHVDMMLHGHVHHYYRTRPMRLGRPVDSPAEGTIYLTSVATRGREKDRKSPDYVVKAMNGGPWYQTFDIDGKRLTFRAYDAAGKRCDELVIRK